MADFYKLFTNFAIVGLIVFGLFAFISIIQSDNNIDNKFMDEPLINQTYGNLQTNLSTYRNQSQAQKTLFESENPTGGFGTILLFSIVSSGKVFNAMIIGVFNTLIKLPVSFLGIDPIIISVISTIMIITIIIGLWILYKLGG